MAFSTKPLTMACSYAFYCPCTASFDGRLYTYNSLTKGKMTHPFQTAYSNSNGVYDSSWLTFELTTLSAANLQLPRKNKTHFLRRTRDRQS